MVALLSGCASSGARLIFEKTGTTEAEIKRDREQCFAESIDPEPAIRASMGFQLNRDVYQACMERRGYSVRTAAGG